MSGPIRAGDAVLVRWSYGDPPVHREETWCVAYADHESGKLAPAGWPDCEVDLSTCELVRSATDEQHEAHVKLWADRVDQRDRRTRHVERLYPAAWAKAGAK